MLDSVQSGRSSVDDAALGRRIRNERSGIRCLRPRFLPSHADLLDAPTLTLATIGPDGRPQLSQIWFLAEDGVVKIALNTPRQKVKNLEANPAVTVFILDTANPQKYLEIRGDATLEPDPDYVFTEPHVRQVRRPADPRLGRPRRTPRRGHVNPVRDQRRRPQRG